MNNDEKQLRKVIRQAILLNEARKRKERIEEYKEEHQLRLIIRKLLAEAVEDQPKHDSTGINVLEDLLKKIIPVIQADFKVLTTSKEQRDSFRAHMLNAIQNILSTEYMYVVSNVDKLAENVNIKFDDNKFIDVLDDEGKPKKGKDKEKEVSPQEEFGKGLEGKNLDTTGRNMAMETFKKIEKGVSDAYTLLDDEKDRSLFYDYLITNLKLYFDKFEEEMAPTVAEPTTPEYEKEKERKSAEDQGEAKPLEI